ncbi:MAG: acireductone synthase [Deltaproteobacteria bacterium]|nr:acireductone synthase [Deltaproteobacteria bacterium]
MAQHEPIKIAAQAVLLDIEGTTTPLAFVKELLFPYARARLPEFVVRHEQDPAVAHELRQIREMAGQELSPREVGALLQTWIDQDRKIAPLKSLQALVWQQGYERGEIKGQVYPDAVRALRAWWLRGVRLYVYSSGAVPAQKALFRHSESGDLSGWFTGHFDLALGSKTQAESYAAIAAIIGLAPGRILFLSDVKAELDAARQAGLQTGWVIRQGALPRASEHPLVASFAELDVFLPV